VGVNQDTRETGSLAQSIAGALLGTSDAVGVPGGLSVGYANIDADFLRAFIEINASEGNTDFNVLSAPHVLTLDNEKAVINISDNVPFITGRVSEAEVGVSSSETFEYRDVGIVLEITPHISPERMVQLEIVQKVNEVSEVTVSGASVAQLSEKKREAETTLMVKDRHTLVLGGLMKDIDTVNINKVPFLGDIPVLGWAFKSKSIERKKTNLLIFITPSIVTTVAEASELTREKRDDAGEQLRDQMERSSTMKRSGMIEGETKLIDAPLSEAGPK
jgi:general secretion pathway protein D